MQCHQELSNKNGLFAVLADMDSLASSLRKVGLERFIRIFSREEDMAAYVPVNASKISITPPKNETDLKSPNIPVEATTSTAAAAPAAPVTETAPATPAAPEKKPEFHGLDKNPLEDESSSSGGCAFVVVVLLIAIAVAAYFFM